MVAAHLQPSTRVAGTRALEVGCILCRARGRVGAIVVVVMVAFVILVLLELVLVVDTLRHVRRCLLQRWVDAAAECGGLRQLRALLVLRLLVLVLVLLVRGGWGQIVGVRLRLRAVFAVEWREECRVNWSRRHLIRLGSACAQTMSVVGGDVGTVGDERRHGVKALSLAACIFKTVSKERRGPHAKAATLCLTNSKFGFEKDSNQ